MQYEEVQGDLFGLDPSEWALAHCISADVTAKKNMNKGIAKIFRNKYPEMASFIESHIETGKAIRYVKGSKVIYNLVPKERVSQKARGKYKDAYYQQLEEALIDMKNQMIENGEKQLGMPKIASGLDGGNWTEISRMIKDTFKDTDITIQIRYL